MQAVILAAGKGTRMGELTQNTPKPMLLVAGRPFLEYILDSLPEEIDEVILIVGYLGEQIENHFKDSYKGKKIKYVWQEKQEGTGSATWLAKDLIKGKFFVQYADDLYSTADLEKCVKEKWALLVLEQTNLIRGGKVLMNEKGELLDIVESNDHGGGAGIFNAGVYVLSSEIFNYPLVKVQDKEEFGLPQTILTAAKDHPITVVKGSARIAITEPKDIKIAEELILAM